MSLRWRLLLAYLATGVVLVGGGGMVLNRQLARGAIAGTDAALHARLVDLETVVPPAGTQVDFQDSPERLATPREAVTQIYDPSGTLIESSQAVGSAPLLDAPHRRAAAQNTIRLTVTLNRDRVRLLAGPVPRPSGPWVLVVGTSLEPALAGVDAAQARLLLAVLLLFAAGAAGTWVLTGAALRPVEQMRNQVAAIQTQDLAARLAVPRSRDELAALAATFNHLLSRLQDARQAQVRLVADAGHELRGPLAVLRTGLDLATRRDRTKADLLQSIRAAAQETERLARLADNLLLLSRSDDDPVALVHRRMQPLPAIIAASLSAAAARAQIQAVRLEATGPEDLLAPVDADRIRQVLDNLLDNALRVSPPESTITVAAGHDGEQIVIEITDEGRGFPTDFLPYAFDRFARADPARGRVHGGTGLGLAIVKAITEAHDGSVEATNSPSGGAVIRVRLPAHQ